MLVASSKCHNHNGITSTSFTYSKSFDSELIVVALFVVFFFFHSLSKSIFYFLSNIYYIKPSFTYLFFCIYTFFFFFFFSFFSFFFFFFLCGCPMNAFEGGCPSPMSCGAYPRAGSEWKQVLHIRTNLLLIQELIIDYLNNIK